MTRHEDLVPPLDLCRRIPEGVFGNSAFVWHEESTPVGCMSELIARKDLAINRGGIIFPAPTLEEILHKMAKCPQRFNSVTCEAYEKDFCVCAFMPYRGKPGSTLVECRDDNGAAAALQLYMHRSPE